MDAILINKELSREETALISSETSLNPSLKVYTMILNQAYPFSAEILTLDSGIKKEISYEAMSITQNFGDETIAGKPNSDILYINGMSLWHYHKYRLHFLLRNAIFEKRIIEQLLPSFDRLVVYSTTPGFDILNETEQLHGKLSQAGSMNAGKNLVSTLRVAFSYSLFLGGRFLIGLLQSFKTKKWDHLIIDRANKQYCIDVNTLRPIYDNYILSNLYAKIDENFCIIDEVEPPKIFTAKKFTLKRWMFHNDHKPIGRIPGEYITLKAILLPSIRRKYKTETAQIAERLNYLANACTTKYQKWITRQLIFFNPSTKFYILRKLSYEHFLAKQKPRTITTIDENSPMLRCIIDSARLLGIKTIGVQHGNVHDLHPAYMLTQGDRNRNVIPDVSVVWGSYWKSFFTESCGYPPEKVIVRGMLRTDIIPALLNHKKEMVEQYLLPDRPFIVYASQPQQDPRLRELAALDVFRAVSRIKDSFLVLKLHPNEENDREYYHNLAKQAGCGNYIIAKKIDLYVLISACQMLITCFSTVGTETVFFRKPLIVLDHLALDLQGYVKQGVGLLARNDTELQHYIEKFISDPLAIDTEAYDKFIKANADSIDGRVAERLISYIKS